MNDNINIFNDIRQAAKENVNNQQATETKRAAETYFTNLDKQAAETKKTQQFYLKVCEEYQNNIRISQQLRSEINNLTNNGGDLKEITIKAIKCIGLMTGDTLFINQNINNLDKY